MGKLTLSLLGVCVLIFGLVVIQAVDPRGTLVGLLFGGCAGVALFITGPIWLARNIMSPQLEIKQERDPIQEKVFSEKSDSEIMDFIDEAINRVPVVANHPWLGENWHKLKIEEKMTWVQRRRSYLNSTLGTVKVPIHLVTALQQADKEFYRNAS